MCGICGILGTNDPELLRGMNDVLSHRGPDSAGYYWDPEQPVGLAMSRLTIIDLDTGSQPVFNEDRSMALVFNGEIYNYKSLSEELKSKGHRFATQSDTEVIVHAYEEYGVRAVDHLDGMFAFALWNRKKKELFCARDRLGIKPFYYYHKGRFFLFGSEQKAVLRGLGDVPEVDRLSLIRHLVIGFYTGPYSMFKDILQLPPGSTLILKEGRVSMARYWRLPFEPCEHRDEDGLPAHSLREAIFQAVRSHLVSDVPVGLTLSGGLDSSIIALLMTDGHNEEPRPPVHAYTVGYGDATDEVPFAQMVTRSLRLTAHEKVFRAEEAMTELPAIVWYLEEPLSNITALTAYLWAKFMSEDLKVTLVGEGADEIMGGYFQYRIFSQPIPLMPTFLGSRLFRYGCLQPPLSLVTNLFGGNRDVASEVRHVYHEEYLKCFCSGEEGGLRSAMRFDIEHELPNNQLLRVDRMSMAHSLEARVPYLCHHLVEQTWAYPMKWKIMGSVQKYLLRKAFEDRLDPEIVRRPKIGHKGSQAIFPILFRAGLFTHMEHILQNSKTSQEWFDPRVIRDLLAGRSGVFPVVGSRIRDKLLYTLFLFVIWHSLFVEKKVTSKDALPRLGDLV